MNGRLDCSSCASRWIIIGVEQPNMSNYLFSLLELKSEGLV